MPNDKVRDETDGDPTTEYEDTSAHERYGLRIGDNGDLTNDQNRKPADLLPGGDY